jgi:hypothetical protein
MKNASLLLTILIFLSATPFISGKDKKGVAGDYFLLSGKVYEINMIEGTEMDAVSAQVVVYQEDEIYVAFFTKQDGLYEFYLPVGHVYKIWFGGSAFVNKIVQVDARALPITKKPADVDLDMGLFRPLDGYDFALLNEPYVMFNYDEEMEEMMPDMEYSEKKAMELDKIFKKIKKEQAKK